MIVEQDILEKLNEHSLDQINGGVVDEAHVQRVAEETLQRVKVQADASAQHHGTSVGSRVMSVAISNVTDFGAFLGGTAMANVAVPKKRNG